MMIKKVHIIATAVLVISIFGCHRSARNYGSNLSSSPAPANLYRADSELNQFQKSVLTSLDRQINSKIWYQDGYYMGGEPPANIGVCTDVVIRSYRSAGVNLQRLMASDVRQSPDRYHILKPDANIDHRRCRNLAVYFKYYSKYGKDWKQLPIEGNNTDWQPGDIVIWSTRGNGYADHIGVVANHNGSDGNPTVVHHWPDNYVKEEDCLYRFPVLYHFRRI